MPISAEPKATQLALSRRNLLNAAASGAIVIALGAPAFAIAGKGETPTSDVFNIDPLALIDESVARAYVGSDFDISSDTSYAKLRLVKVVSNLVTPKKAQAIQTVSFVMEFEVLSNAGELVQNTYHISHPKLGVFNLLLVPHANGEGKKALLATFNRFK